MRHEPQASAADTQHVCLSNCSTLEIRKGIDGEAYDNSDYVRGFGENIIRCYQTTVLVDKRFVPRERRQSGVVPGIVPDRARMGKHVRQRPLANAWAFAPHLSVAF